MAKATLNLTFSFADETTRKLELGALTVEAADVETIRTKVKAFDPATVAGLYLSDGGATCTGISAANITITNETEINLND